MTSTTAPHVLAAADQFLAARAHGASTVEVRTAVFKWIGRQWSAGTPAGFVDETIEGLALHLASHALTVPPCDVRDGAGIALDPAEALAHAPGLHGVLVPHLLVVHVRRGEVVQARQSWGVMALAPISDQLVRNARSEIVINALGRLVCLSGPAVAL